MALCIVQFKKPAKTTKIKGPDLRAPFPGPPPPPPPPVLIAGIRTGSERGQQQRPLLLLIWGMGQGGANGGGASLHSGGGGVGSDRGHEEEAPPTSPFAVLPVALRVGSHGYQRVRGDVVKGPNSPAYKKILQRVN